MIPLQEPTVKVLDEVLPYLAQSARNGISIVRILNGFESIEKEFAELLPVLNITSYCMYDYSPSGSVSCSPINEHRREYQPIIQNNSLPLLLVDDAIDTGKTLHNVYNHFKSRSSNDIWFLPGEVFSVYGGTDSLFQYCDLAKNFLRSTNYSHIREAR